MRKSIVIMLLCAVFMSAACAQGIEIVMEETHETYEQDGTLLATLDVVYPQLSGMADTQTMHRVNAAIRQRILEEGEYDIIRGYALQDFTEYPQIFAENDYGLEGYVEAELLKDGAILAVRYDLILFTGGPHPWDVIAARHFDLSTGMPVTLESLSPDPEGLRARVAEETLRWIDRTGFDAFDGAQEWPLKNGLLTVEGLLVFFNEGDLGPVSEGAVEILIPYDRLAGVLEF